MSQDLVVQLSDEAYSAIRRYADESGISPARATPHSFSQPRSRGFTVCRAWTQPRRLTEFSTPYAVVEPTIRVQSRLRQRLLLARRG
jgi:hypothetical protein